MSMNKSYEQQLKVLEKCSDLQLLDALAWLDNDPAPMWVKDIILNKINSVMNDRLVKND